MTTTKSGPDSGTENPIPAEPGEKENPKSEGDAPSGAGRGQEILDAIADNLSSDMPEVQEHALEQEKLTQDAELAQYSHLKDTEGNTFDPAVHKTNKSGEPTLSTKGKLIKKPGRKMGSKNSQAHSFVGGPGKVPDSRSDKVAAQRMQARASGTMAANLVLQIGIVAGGDEWMPRIDEASGLNEKLMLENSFADYFEATGKTDIPPGMALTVAIGAYALPRFTMPKTQSRLGKLKMGFKKWAANRKLKKHGMRAESQEQHKEQSDTLVA